MDLDIIDANEKFTFFWKGELSQWFKRDFVVCGTLYNTAEQYMMASKAKLMKDTETLDKIMKSTSPREQKDLGREVKNFNSTLWDRFAKDVVFVGNYAKFVQNEDLLDLLLATRGTTLVEASPYDKIWGIGLEADDEEALERSTWKGLNWLGETLTNVCECIYHADLIEKYELNDKILPF
jgi:ribA/ribD-fused uncharacterized protein